MTMPSTPVTLSNPGLRTDRMDAERANVLVEQWQAQLAEKPGSFIETVDFHDRVYDPESVPILVQFLSDKLSRCSVALLNDIIASLPTEKGLLVLGGFATLFKDVPLVELNVSDNAIGKQGLDLASFQTLLKCKTLERLYMENNGLDEECMKQLAEILLEEDDDDNCVCDRLTLLHFYNNMSGIGGARAVGTIVARCRKLQSFRYEGCRPQPIGCQSIANGVLKCSQNCDTLTTVRLEGSYGKDESLDPIGTLTLAFQNFSQLTHVTLYDAALESKGTKLLCKSLKRHTLQSFEIPQNEVTKMTVDKAIKDLVKGNTTSLKVLNLSSNELTSTGVESLMGAFQEGNTVLEILKLGENMIGTRGAMSLIDNAGKFPFLKELHVDDNGFPEDVVDQLREAFGEKLIEMENNDDDDKDDDLDSDANDEEDDESDDDDVDNLTQQFDSQVHV